MQPREPRPDQRKWVRSAAMAGQVGATLVAATFVGWYVGQWPDRRLSTEPWLTMLFSLFGIAAGFIEMFRVVLRISREEEDRGEDH